MAQIIHMVAGIEAAAGDAAAGGCGGGQDGSFDEGCRVVRPQPQPNRFRPPLDPPGRLEALGSCRAGLLAPTDELVDGRRAGRAEVSQGAATIACTFMRMWRI